jgi:hypothetical protein
MRPRYQSRSPHLRRGAAATATAAALALSGLTLAAGPADGASKVAAAKSKLAVFKNCPTDNPAVSACIIAKITSGTFALGSTTVKVTQPISVQLGLEPDGHGGLLGIVPDDGQPGLKSPVIYIPGGIPGLAGIPGFPSSGNALDAGFLPALDGTVDVNINNLLTQSGPAFSLPVSAAIVNEFISSSCTIEPIPVDATDGTTDPPAGVTPLKGGLGKVSVASNGLITITGLKLVDNTFPVPATQNCYALGVVPADQVLDTAVGLPAAPGKSSASLVVSAELAPAPLVVKAGY